jgi:hypothetical protein
MTLWIEIPSKICNYALIRDKIKIYSKIDGKIKNLRFTVLIVYGRTSNLLDLKKAQDPDFSVHLVKEFQIKVGYEGFELFKNRCHKAILTKGNF